MFWLCMEQDDCIMKNKMGKVKILDRLVEYTRHIHLYFKTKTNTSISYISFPIHNNSKIATMLKLQLILHKHEFPTQIVLRINYLDNITAFRGFFITTVKAKVSVGSGGAVGQGNHLKA